MKLTDEQLQVFNAMLPVYGAEVSQVNTGKILNKSSITLYRMREQGVGPRYKKGHSKSKNGSVVYPLHEIVRYLTTSNVMTA